MPVPLPSRNRRHRGAGDTSRPPLPPGRGGPARSRRCPGPATWQTTASCPPL